MSSVQETSSTADKTYVLEQGVSEVAHFYQHTPRTDPRMVNTVVHKLRPVTLISGVIQYSVSTDMAFSL